MRLKDVYKATAVAISKTACLFKEVRLRRVKRVIGRQLVSYPDSYSRSCGWITSPLRGKKHGIHVQAPAITQLNIVTVRVVHAGVIEYTVRPNFRSGGPNSLGNTVPRTEFPGCTKPINRTQFPRELSPPPPDRIPWF